MDSHLLGTEAEGSAFPVTAMFGQPGVRIVLLDVGSSYPRVSVVMVEGWAAMTIKKPIRAGRFRLCTNVPVNPDRGHIQTDLRIVLPIRLSGPRWDFFVNNT